MSGLNFLKSIGQHAGCAGLDAIWVEAGIFVVMEGKTYYRAVRWNMPVVEALRRIKWESFRRYVIDKYSEEVD